MRSEIYTEKYDVDVAKWILARKLPLPPELPQNGVVVLDAISPIAVGFVRKVEGGYGITDTYVTNPEVSPEIRDKALDLLTNDLCALCVSLGITKIMATTTDTNTITRAIRHGYVKLPHTVIALDLSQTPHEVLK